MSKEIAEKIILELRRQKKTQSWLAGEIGETKQNLCLTLKRLEEGKSMSVEKLEKISNVLDITFKIG